MISREQVIKGLECLAQRQEPTANPCKECGYINRPNFAVCVKDIASDALELLKEQPEVVRCKDCKHFEPDGIYTMCYRHNGLSQNADWYCADGERR